MTLTDNAHTTATGAIDDTTPASRLRVEAATIGYDKRVIAENLNISIPDDSFTVIVGPNACGKSTLLRALSRLLRPQVDQVVLDGRSISSYKAKDVARRLGLLPQSSIAPDGITVADLVARGRYPHQKLIRQWTDTDERAVLEVVEHLVHLADVRVPERPDAPVKLLEELVAVRLPIG